MKTIALLIAGMLMPQLHAQDPKKSIQQKMEPPFADVYTTANVRSAKLAAEYTAKAAELNKRRAALEEEGKKIDAVELSEKYKNSHHSKQVATYGPNREFTGFRTIRPPQPPSNNNYNGRVQALREEMQAFRRETSAEFGAKRTGEAASAKYVAARQKAIADAVGPVTPAPVAPAAPAQPVAEAKPSSVPGFPAGVEPAKKAPKDLPPGMSKR
ncbi:hypothetical protein [Luteolibacter sp. Populi]|uniref:hypothetical protein n=1 Tax=Luteolibacter sp. Populi TaxID=3230487 RepID=UPI00346728CC